ncbi:hypothetical protein [Pseudomonas amygdali]|uniref:Uncharacterized protein n=1 Tax=Pseudomonas amygdali pv. lachrymans str. M301315 TaxID=629260 RepID=A0AAD0VAC5_PSEAV|nr:hypothetical protein [Pseudomonas amygdali]AXH60232.1 hypothetical protein PLA107_034155 [Pseudomonas amygdali pv. lachrymans str. M301315]RMT06084.1 hypothetical protein ALP54_04063 [Pseudomonas amygdali pv. lachrymans]
MTEIAPVIEKWIKNSSGQALAIGVGGAQAITSKDGSLIRVLTAGGICQVSLSTPDPRDDRRKWITTIGIGEKTPTGGREFSVSLDFKGPAPKRLFLNPPLVVDQIAQAFAEGKTPGVQVSVVEESNLTLMAQALESPGREWPVVLVSPMKAGGYAVDLVKLRSRLVGWASLEVMPEDANFAQIKDALSPLHYCFNGAIKVIMPLESTVQGGVVMPGREGQVNQGFNEQEVLGRVAKFANPYHAQRQLRIEPTKATPAQDGVAPGA